MKEYIRRGFSFENAIQTGYMKWEDKNLDLEYGNDIVEMERYIRDYFEEHNMSQSMIALDFAIRMHQNQVRGEGIAYIIHPMTMVCHALSLDVTEDDMIAVILLHDVCEDCPVEVEDLPVNDKVRSGVDHMTFLQKNCEDKSEAMERYYQKIRENREACLTKLFDRCHNVSSMSQAFSDEKICSYIAETKKYVYPLFRYVKDTYSEFTQVVFVLEYHTKSVIEAYGRSV